MITFVPHDRIMESNDTSILAISVCIPHNIQPTHHHYSKALTDATTRIMELLITHSQKGHLEVSDRPEICQIERTPHSIYAEYDDNGFGIGDPIGTAPGEYGCYVELMVIKHKQ